VIIHTDFLLLFKYFSIQISDSFAYLGPSSAEHSPTRFGWYRSVSNIPRSFAVQSATAELAAELGKDQKDFLLEMIGHLHKLEAKASGLPNKFWNQYEPQEEFPFDTDRLVNAVRLVAEKAG